MDQTTLVKIATACRQVIVGDNPSNGKCYNWSWCMCKTCKELGIEIRMVNGAYLCSVPPHTNDYGSSHFWCEYEDNVVDGTGDQFNGQSGVVLPEIVCGTYAQFPRYRMNNVVNTLAVNYDPTVNAYKKVLELLNEGVIA